MAVAGKGPPPVVMIPTRPQNKLLRSHINYCTSFCAKFGYYLLHYHTIRDLQRLGLWLTHTDTIIHGLPSVLENQKFIDYR